MNNEARELLGRLIRGETPITPDAVNELADGYGIGRKRERGEPNLEGVTVEPCRSCGALGPLEEHEDRCTYREVWLRGNPAAWGAEYGPQ